MTNYRIVFKADLNAQGVELYREHDVKAENIDEIYSILKSNNYRWISELKIITEQRNGISSLKQQ